MENSDDEALPMENSKEEALPMENYKEEALPMENFDDDDDATLFRSVLMVEVLGKLSLPDIARLSCVCRSLRDLLTESPFLTIDDCIFQGTYFQSAAGSRLETNCSLLREFASLKQLEYQRTSKYLLQCSTIFHACKFSKIEWASLSSVEVRSFDLGIQL